MKTLGNKLKMSLLVWLMIFPALVIAQGGLQGSWKYSSPEGEMTMQINPATIVINGQTFSYKAQGNVLMINEGYTSSPYPFMLDGSQLTIEFPGGAALVFNRITTGTTPPVQLPQSMSRPSDQQHLQGSSLTGKWIYQSPQGNLVLEFLSANQLIFNGETTQYQLKEGVIQAKGDYGWIDYPYSISQDVLTVTFPDGTRIPFSRSAQTTAVQPGVNQTGMNRQATAEGINWQLKGALCSWSGSSTSSSSYSRTKKLVFDGQGNYQFGNESSFSGDAGIAYSGNPNVETGTYRIGENSVILVNQAGESWQFRINMRQNNGMITELMYEGTLYAKALCE